MKRELLAAVLFAIGAISNARAEETNAPAPKIHFDKTLYDFGTTSLVDSVTGTFTFENAGQAELKISKPQPSCGCTVASVKPDVLKPGEKGELVFTVRVAGARGVLEKHINVPSNDPQAPNVNLSIKADMRQVLELSPSQISFGNIRQGVMTNETVVVRRTDGKKLVIAKTETTSNLVRVKTEPINDESAKLILELEGEGAPRRLTEQVRVFLEGSTQPAANVSLYAQLIGDVSVTPERLYWPITDAARATNANVEAFTVRRITVTSNRAEPPLQIVKAASSLKDIGVDVVTIETGKIYSVVAKLTEVPNNSEEGSISFETNSSTQPKVTIPVTITVLKPNK